jgi:MATE family multidrug resistance protein
MKKSSSHPHRSILRWADYQSELKTLFHLAYPIFLAQLALTGLGFLDTAMSGWVGREDLAAIGLGSSLFMPVFMISTGILLAITPLVSQLVGADQLDRISQTLSQGLWLALPLGLLSAFILIKSEIILDYLSLSPKVYQLTADYLDYVAWGLPGVALYQALRFFWEGLGRTLPTMAISFIALFLNIPLNALFIYGLPGLVDPMGAAGCGVATTLVMWSMFFIGALYVWRHPEIGHWLKRAVTHRPSWHLGSKQILNIGVPNTLALLFEVSLFSFIALFVAKLGTLVLASHQVAISYTSMAFMLPLSFAMAVTVRIAHAYGSGQKAKFQLVLRTSFSVTLALGVGLALLTYLGRDVWVILYTQDPEVMKLAALLLVYAASYQIFDAVQATAAGVLRGLGDTRFTMFVTLVTYWGIGLGGGYLLGMTDVFTPRQGVEGFWLGIILGLGAAAILLSWRVLWQEKQFFQREIHYET